MDDSIEKVVHAWTAVDFPRLQRDVDTKALEIQDTTSSSLQERKELAQATKEFKKLDDDKRLESINPLLKRYQSVIDNLNKRGKASESVLLSIWRSLIAVPDPTPLLSDALNNVSLRKELDNLRKENDSLQEKITSLADYDDIKRESVKERERLEKMHNLQMKAKDDEWTAKLAEMERLWSEEKEKLTKQVVELQVSEKFLRSKIGNVDEDDEEEYQQIPPPPPPPQLDSTIKSLEKRNEELRRELVASKSNIDVTVEKAVQEKEKMIESLERENVLVSAKLDAERLNCKKLKKEKEELTSSFERHIKQLEHDISNLQEYKSNTSDYEEIRKELEILRQIQFGDDDENNDDNSNNNDDIESAIVARNKKLNAEIVEIRRKYDDSLKKCKEFSNNVQQLQNTIDELKDSNTRLENDLLNFNHHSISRNNVDDEQWETMSMISSVAGGNTSTIKGKISPAASIAGTERSYEGTTGIIGTNTSSSLLPIITQQRDRFRTRNKELEEDNKKNFGKIVELKREINNLKNDNRQLYEKIRFLEYHKQIPQPSIGDIENRYRSEYENELHPIEQFRLMETQRINSNITPWDRVFIQITRTILATPFTRWMFVAYCTSLHLLVMILMLTSR